MKYLVLIPDGMADRPSEKLSGKTPMEIANKPTMDALAAKSLCGTVLNGPTTMVPESDTANLAIMSYDPRKYSKGRSPLEAVSLGITLGERDTAIRCNLHSTFFSFRFRINCKAYCFHRSAAPQSPPFPWRRCPAAGSPGISAAARFR